MSTHAMTPGAALATTEYQGPTDYLPPVDPKAVEQAMLIGDLSQMTDEQRIAYYVAVCRSVGLNPLTKPFQALKGDDGKLSLYPDKGCAEQLRKLHRVSTKVLGRDFFEGLYIVTVQASTPDGRTEEAQAVVPLVKPKGRWEEYDYRGQQRRRFKAEVDQEGQEVQIPLSPTERATSMMRCETKAKRRVTLAITGLGLPEWDQEPDQTAHPMALSLHTPPPPAPEAPLAETVAALYGEGSDPTAPSTLPGHADAPPPAPSRPSTAQNGPQATVTGEVAPHARPPEARSAPRGPRREPAPAASDATTTAPQGETAPPPDLSGPDLFAKEEQEETAEERPSR
jgi:hypothetical protein